MTKYFGTDGVRGIANKELTPELAFKLGRIGGYVLTKEFQGSHKCLLDEIHVSLVICLKMRLLQVFYRLELK